MSGVNLSELESELVCPVCQKACGSKRGKENHMRVKHRDLKLETVDRTESHPWACPHCGALAKDKAGVNRHMTWRHSDKDRKEPIFKLGLMEFNQDGTKRRLSVEESAPLRARMKGKKEMVVVSEEMAQELNDEVDKIKVVRELKPTAYQEPKPIKQEEDEMRGIQKGESRIKKMEAELQKLEDKKARILGEFALAEERAKQAIEKAKADLETERLKSVDLMDGINDSLTEGQKMIRFAKSMLEEMKN